MTDAVLCTYGPPAERRRVWVVIFDDPDQHMRVFHDRDEAIYYWTRYSESWACTLFVTETMADYDKRAVMAKRLEQLK